MEAIEGQNDCETLFSVKYTVDNMQIYETMRLPSNGLEEQGCDRCAFEAETDLVHVLCDLGDGSLILVHFGQYA